MKRLTKRIDGEAAFHECAGICATCTSAESFCSGAMVERLAAYEDTGLGPEDIDALQKREQGLAEMLVNISCGCTVTYARLAELAQAEKDGRLVVLEPVPAAKEGAKKPTCFYNDMGQNFCLGFGRGREDDEPIDRCKECWYCESTREAEEETL